MKSKRNKVLKIDQKIVKTFINGNYERELMIYERLKAAKVSHATIYDIRKHEIVMEFLKGRDLLSVFLECEKNLIPFEGYLNLWFDYMQEFYLATKDYRHGDVHLANFIVVDKMVVGLDFEQAIIESPIKDMTDMVCYILLYDPILTSYKIDTIKTWFKKHPWNNVYKREEWIQELEESLNRLNNRRNSNYDINWEFLFCKEE